MFETALSAEQVQWTPPFTSRGGAHHPPRVAEGRIHEEKAKAPTASIQQINSQPYDSAAHVVARSRSARSLDGFADARGLPLSLLRSDRNRRSAPAA
jgi:hypothetical protein